MRLNNKMLFGLDEFAGCFPEKLPTDCFRSPTEQPYFKKVRCTKNVVQSRFLGHEIPKTRSVDKG